MAEGDKIMSLSANISHGAQTVLVGAKVADGLGGKALSLAGSIVVGALLPVAVVAYWWWAANAGYLNPRIYSSPQLILARAADLVAQGQLQDHVLVSLQRAGTGFLIGSAIGIVLGIFTGFFKPLERLLDPSIQIFRAIPLSSVLPLFVVWFGFGELPKILVIVCAVVPKLYVDTYAGIKNTDKKLLEVAKVFRLSRFQTVVGIILPSAAPFIFNSLRIASVTSLILLVFAEALNAKSGLGYLATQGMTYFQTDLIFLVVFIYALLGLAADTLIRLFEQVATPWRGRRGVR